MSRLQHPGGRRGTSEHRIIRTLATKCWHNGCSLMRQGGNGCSLMRQGGKPEDCSWWKTGRLNAGRMRR